jgi:hypothetical protein
MRPTNRRSAFWLRRSRGTRHGSKFLSPALKLFDRQYRNTLAAMIRLCPAPNFPSRAYHAMGPDDRTSGGGHGGDGGGHRQMG